jgi:hypothetical protein
MLKAFLTKKVLSKTNFLSLKAHMVLLTEKHFLEKSVSKKY